MPMGNSGESAIADERRRCTSARPEVLSTAAVPSWRDVGSERRSAGVVVVDALLGPQQQTRGDHAGETTPMPREQAVVSTRTGVSSRARGCRPRPATPGYVRAFGRDRRELVPAHACSRSWVREVEEVLGAEVEELVAMRFIERVLDPDEVALVGRVPDGVDFVDADILRHAHDPGDMEPVHRAPWVVHAVLHLLALVGRERGEGDVVTDGSVELIDEGLVHDDVRADSRRGAWSRRASTSCHHTVREVVRGSVHEPGRRSVGVPLEERDEGEHRRALDAREGRDIVAGHHRHVVVDRRRRA